MRGRERGHAQGVSDLAVAPASTALRGSLTVPGDKSIAHRALLFAALAAGRTRISGLPERSRRALDAALPRSTRRRNQRRRRRRRRRRTRRRVLAAVEALDCGNSGTTMRLFPAFSAARSRGYARRRRVAAQTSDAPHCDAADGDGRDNRSRGGLARTDTGSRNLAASRIRLRASGQ